MSARACAALVFVASSALAFVASAQPGRRLPPITPPPSAPTVPGNLRAHVGTDYVARLLRSTDPDERIRGIERAATVGSAEAVAALVTATESSPAVRSDPRALLGLARALSRFAAQDRVRAALLLIVNAATPSIGGHVAHPGRAGGTGLSADEGDPVARVELARQTAAIAIARSGEGGALEKLYGVARGGGSGQTAARTALLIEPPRDPAFFGGASITMPVSVVRMLGELGDLRAIEVLRAAARAADVSVRCAALVSLAELGDERTTLLARAAIAESDARLRAAAGEAFVLLSAPERFKAVPALIADETTAMSGVRLAERVYSADITKLLAARALGHPDRELRAASIRALGRSPEPAAAAALAAPQIMADPTFGYFAALALARSPAPNAMQVIDALSATKASATLGVRAYVVRALVRGERSSAGDDVLARLAASKDGRERALGTFGRVALGASSLDAALADPDARVRRAAATASLARPSRRSSRALLAQLHRETDAPTRQVLAAGLLDGDAAGALTTTELLDRAESGGADAALAAYAFARRADEPTEQKVEQLLTSQDAVIRAHTARGLAFATLPDATGHLAHAYAYETDELVRRAVIEALAARTQDATAPARKATLETAAQLDPDGPTRQLARRGVARGASLLGATLRDGTLDTTWLRVTLDGGGAPSGVYVGSVVRADGVAVPIAFDDDGFAIVPGLPPGQARLVLAPRLPSYDAKAP